MEVGQNNVLIKWINLSSLTVFRNVLNEREAKSQKNIMSVAADNPEIGKKNKAKKNRRNQIIKCKFSYFYNFK